MKKSFLFLIAAVMGMAALAGCKKSDSSAAAPYHMSAIINGVGYNTNDCNALNYFGTVEIGGNISFATSITVYPDILLVISNYTGVGTYVIDSLYNTFEVDSSNMQLAPAAAGQVTITTASATTIAGTFTFTCTDGTNVANGSFTAKWNY